MAGHVLDLKPLQIEDVGYGDAAQTVKLSGVLNQVFSQPEFVVAFDPSNARVGQRAPEGAQNAPPDFDLLFEFLARARRQVVA